MHSSHPHDLIHAVALHNDSAEPAVQHASCPTQRVSTADKPCTVYIIICNDATFYTGIAANVSRRFRQHQAGHVHYTRHRKPVHLVATVPMKTRRAAAKLERRIKNTGAMRWLKRHSKDVRLALHTTTDVVKLLRAAGLGGLNNITPPQSK